MKNLFVTFFILLNCQVLNGQLTLSYLNISTTLTTGSCVATYSFVGSGTDTIGAYIVDQGYNVKLTYRHNFIVTAGLYTDTIIMSSLPDNMYSFVLTHGAIPFASKKILKTVLASISNAKKEEQITVYPNPFRNWINVDVNKSENENITLTIFDMLGEVVYFENDNILKKEINLEGFPQGIYFISVKKNGVEQKLLKLVKE